MSCRRQRKYSLPAKDANSPSMKARLLKGKYLVILAGAGNGLGSAIAGLAFQEDGILPDAWAGSKLCLIDIDEYALNETAGLKMKQFMAHRKIGLDIFTVDLSSFSEIENLMKSLAERYDKDFERVILVNNAGTIGKVENLLTVANEPLVTQSYWDLNITSKMCLTSQVCRIFVQSAKTIVNISSRDLATPTASLGLPCMASRAMETFDVIFAKENSNIQVIRYVTDRLDKRSTRKILERSRNPNLREEIREAVKEGKLTLPLDAAKVLIKVLENSEFRKGEVKYV